MAKKPCSVCDVLNPTDYVVSNVTHRMHKVINNDLPSVCNCKTSNIIYLITCSTCNMQYVGETGCPLNKRLCEHRSNIKSGKRNTYLSLHFNSGHCKGSSYSMQVLENLEGNGRTEHNALDRSQVPNRRARETDWMMKLRTVYPYGLNEKTGEENNFGQTERNYDIVGKNFPKLPRLSERTCESRHRKNNFSSFDCKQFLENFSNQLNNSIRNAANYIRVVLSSMKKKHMKELACHFREILEGEGDDYSSLQWYMIALDIIETRLYKPPPEKPKRKPSKYRMNINFANKALDFINLPKILRSEKLQEYRPEKMEVEDVPMVVYTLSDSIRPAILNYAKFVNELDLDAFHTDDKTIPCHCHEFDAKFVDTHHKHIITGDLSIIKNNKLRKLISKGPKYREPVKINWEEAQNEIVKGLDQYIEDIAARLKVKGKDYFSTWKNNVLKMVGDRISKIKESFIERDVHPVLKDDNVKTYLKSLHNKFVLVPIDKASNNIAIICKRLYASIIHKELNFSNIGNLDNTYERIGSDTPDDIIKKHVEYQKDFGIKVDTCMRKLPSMYWTPKMHKNPIGARFIIASKFSSLKLLSKDITSIFRLIFAHVKKYHGKATFFSGIKQFWVVENNSDVTSAINRISSKDNAKRISTYDFSTLYTKIPHGELLDVLNKLVDFTFNNNNRKYMSVTKTANWVTGKIPVKKLYDVKKVKWVLKYLIENCYFTVGNILFRQNIGIPMGSDPAPFFANLFLFSFESEWIKKTKKDDYGRVKRLNNTFRFIDDLIAINDGGEFWKSYRDIYPPALTLKKENSDDSSATFLDMEISIVDKKFEHKLYDKRDSYKFSIVRFPYKKSNIPSKMFLSTIGAETLRICRATSNYSTFLDAVNPFMKRMKKQGANSRSLNRILSRFTKRHSPDFKKYKLKPEQIIKDILKP